MIWTVEWDDRARRELRKLDQQVQQEILRYLRERVTTDQDPRRFGKQLGGDMLGLWRYRVGDHRIICHIEDDKVAVLVLGVGHRKEIYR